MNNKDLKWNTRQRLAYIETKAYYTGVVSRSDVAQTFAISAPAATKDLKLYNDLAPDNLRYQQREFGFTPTLHFKASFADLAPAAALNLIVSNMPSAWLATQKLPLFNIHAETLLLPTRLPKKEIVAEITRAIFQKKQLNIAYASLNDRSEQAAQRIIEPHALVNTGLRWHVRAYNENGFDFRDFVLSRILTAERTNDAALSSAEHDEDWCETLSLQLAPHPKLKPQAQQNLLIDYGNDEGEITLNVRRAMIGYALRAMAVDTSANASQNPNAFHLVLLNRDEVEIYAQWALL